MKFKDIIEKSLGRIKDNEVASKIIKNAGWLVGDKVFTMIIGVFVMAIVTRYLGPDNYGLYNYALAFATLFTALSTLGLETLSVKSIVNKSEEEGTILFTSLVLRISGGIVLTFLSSIIIRFVAPNEPLIHMLVLIMSFTMVIKSLEVIEYWIQAYLKSKISSLIRIIASVFSSLFKVIFVLLEGNLLHLAFIFMSDALIIGIALIFAYFKNRDLQTKWKFSFKYARNVLSQSWYLILSGLMITLYMQIDKIMLGSMLPSKVELGIYSAATQIASMWYFVPLAVVTSFTPVIMSKKEENGDSYLKTVQLLYTIVAWIGIGFGIFILMFSKIIINTIYGTDYSNAANILTVSIWAGTFAVLGSARAVWLISEGLQKYSIFYIGVGAIINISINFILIPIYGGIGAAVGTLAAQITVAIIAPAILKSTRKSSIMILRAFKLAGILKR